MKQTVIILLPIEHYDRIVDAETLENKNFYSLEEIKNEFKEHEDRNNPLIYTSLSNFMLDCNDQNINLELYWLTYVNLLT